MNKFLIFLCLATFSCISKHKHKPEVRETTMNYESLIELLNSISIKYQNNIEFPHTLFEDKRFIQIIDSSEKYKELLTQVLKDTLQPKVIKQVSLYSLQHLCIRDYITVLQIVIQGYKNNRLDHKFLMSAITQDEFSFEVYKNYDNPDLIKLLKMIKDNEIKIDDETEYIDNILSGKTWHDISKYYQEMGYKLPWSCDK